VLRLDSDTAPSRHGSVRGRLIHGDNLGVMRALLPELEGRVDLIYADPPFNTGRAYPVRLGRGEDSRRPDTWKRAPAFRDRWLGQDAYLDMLGPRLRLMHRLLSAKGTLYLHLDWRSSARARILLDEIFGPDRILNEIVWLYHGPSPIRSAFKRKHDTILVYTKSDQYAFNADAVRVPYDAATIKAFASSSRAGFGKRPRLVRGKVPEDWWYFPVVARLHKERTGFPTQKPFALLDRIVRASSQRGDLVADFFCGSGTTAAAAAAAGRRWLACDDSPAAIATTYRRLLLEAAGQRFQVWTTEDRLSLGGGLRLHWSLDGRNLEVALASTSLRRAGVAGASEVNVWEVDWEAGDVFASREHAVRPWRSEKLEMHLRHRYPRPGRYRVRVRAWDGRGRLHEQERAIQVE
jgi:DNA modification methylase